MVGLHPSVPSVSEKTIGSLLLLWFGDCCVTYFILCYAGMPVADKWKKALLWLMNVIMYIESERGEKGRYITGGRR